MRGCTLEACVCVVCGSHVAHMFVCFMSIDPLPKPLARKPRPSLRLLAELAGGHQHHRLWCGRALPAPPTKSRRCWQKLHSTEALERSFCCPKINTKSQRKGLGWATLAARCCSWQSTDMLPWECLRISTCRNQMLTMRLHAKLKIAGSAAGT